MDPNIKFLIDECLSPELVEIVRVEFGYFATHVPWLGAPPSGQRSWKDWQIVDVLATNPHVLVTNNRRDFVEKYFERADLDPHDGLIILLEKNDLELQKVLFRKVMVYLGSIDTTINRLIEIDNAGRIRAAFWPSPPKVMPWRDPFKP